MELTPKLEDLLGKTQPEAAGSRMPALAGGTAAHAHSVHSALVTLEALGVGAHRIQLRRVGRDARASGSVLWQSPPAGTELRGGTRVELGIAGLGFTQALPVGMWDSGGEAAAGTREILEALDDPLDKLKHWFHEGAPLFRLAPDDLAACARWLQLFGVDPDEWPEAMWYRLATAMASLPQMSGSEEGCAFALGFLLDLPVSGFRYEPVFDAVAEGMVSRLGSRASRLGVDLLLGDRVEDAAVTVIEVGPVTLAAYEHFAESDKGVALLRQVLELLMPLPANYQVSWRVQDPSRPPELGKAVRNSRLGVNSHLGATLPAPQEAALRNAMTVMDLGSGLARLPG